MSYPAVCRKASRASRRRSSSVVPPGCYRVDDLVVAVRVDDDSHVGMVLRGRPNHRGPADVDLLDGVERRGAGCHGRGERIEVDHHELERRDAEFRELGLVVLEAQVGEQPGVDGRVQRLDPPVERLRESGDALDIRHVETRLSDGGCRRPRRDELDALADERCRELDEPGLVAHGRAGHAGWGWRRVRGRGRGRGVGRS